MKMTWCDLCALLIIEAVTAQHNTQHVKCKITVTV